SDLHESCYDSRCRRLLYSSSRRGAASGAGSDLGLRPRLLRSNSDGVENQTTSATRSKITERSQKWRGCGVFLGRCSEAPGSQRCETCKTKPKIGKIGEEQRIHEKGG